MSETSKPAVEAAKRPSQTAVDAPARTMKEAVSQASQTTQAVTDRTRDASQGMAESVAETATAATDISTKVADQGREVMLLGVRTAAGVSSRVADISFGRSHHLLTSSVHAMDMYREASERSAERVQALLSSAITLGRGIQQMQHAWLEILDHTLEHATHKPQDLLRCKSLVEVAEVQRDLYLDMINHALESSTRILELASRTAQEAVRPLQTTAH